MNKKVKVVLIVLLIIALMAGMFFLGQYVANNNNNKEEVETNLKEEKKEEVENNIETDKTEEQVVEKDIYQKIEKIKKDQTIEKVDKVNKIFKLINEYAMLDYKNPVCELFSSDSSEEFIGSYNCFDKSGIGYEYVIDKNIESITLIQLWSWDFDKQSESNLESLRNNSYYNIYGNKLLKILSTDNIIDYMTEKYNISSDAGGACMGYSYKDGDDYFYLNISHAKRGWYDFNRGTGICNNKVKDLVTYKFNIKTDKYEVIEK